MTERYPYESEIDALMRAMREDPKIETERARNYQHWWQPDRKVLRDTCGGEADLGATPNERDMAYVCRRADPQGGRG